MTAIILASGSPARHDMLANAGVKFEVMPAKIDEETILRSLQAEGAKPHDIADALAEFKAKRVADKHPDFVIGADQILVCEGEIFQKAKTLQEAREKLLALRGRPHELLSAVVIYEDHKPVWRKIGRAQLFMRDFSETFLDDYIDRHGNALLISVGCYFLEAEGANLFTRVQGDYFTVLGFPLLDVLGYLRGRGVLPS